MSDTYEKPEHGWTCFHCGETFTTRGSAAAHFGADPSAIPGCMLKVKLGAERGLLMALRRAEIQLARYMEEDSTDHRRLAEQQLNHSRALLEAEELGYERGLRDAAKQKDDK